MSHKILFVSRSAPYGSARAKDTLDALLASAAYDQALSLLFIDDGVFQLLEKQDAQPINQKTISRLLQVLTLYDIEDIYVHRPSLEERGLSKQLIDTPNIIFLNDNETQSLLGQQEKILSF